MGRAPCCDKMGLKKGPWTPEEDQILVAHTQRYGHGNWRALPKQAGLLRCGKSCRLRWTNYLRPDIKRGNFTREEEETIISLHEMLGNRWSAIAARLPGRTDNEIKNVWHTHLKKRVSPNPAQESRRKPRAEPNHDSAQSPSYSVVTRDGTNGSSSGVNEECMDDSLQGFPEIDESFWSDALSMNATSSFKDPFGSSSNGDGDGDGDGDEMSFWLKVFGDGDEMSFWLKVFMESGDSLELPDI